MWTECRVKNEQNLGEVFKRFRHHPAFLRTNVWSGSYLTRLPLDNLWTFFSAFDKVADLCKRTQQSFDKSRKSRNLAFFFSTFQVQVKGIWYAMVTLTMSVTSDVTNMLSSFTSSFSRMSWNSKHFHYLNIDLSEAIICNSGWQILILSLPDSNL